MRGWIWYWLGCIGVYLGHNVFHSCGFQLQMYNCYYYEGDLVVIVVGASVGRGVRVSMFGGYIARLNIDKMLCFFINGRVCE